MQKSFSTGHPTGEHIPALKKLWADVFGDSSLVINNFFEKTARSENTVCVFCGNEPVSVMYAVEAEVYVDGKQKNAYYIYAVCTRKDYRGKGLMAKAMRFLEESAKESGISYLFLVPAENSLFSMYEKFGFSIAFKRRKRVVQKSDYCLSLGQVQSLSFNEYKEKRLKHGAAPQAVLRESGFDSFYKPVGCEMNCISIKDKGFAVYEVENGIVSVFEAFGDENELLSTVFRLTGVNELFVYDSEECGAEPYGMIKSLDCSPLFDNGFFGVSYGG